VIVKEKTSPVPADKFGRAGHAAETQMAFYLRRAFAEASDVFVTAGMVTTLNAKSAEATRPLTRHARGAVKRPE
jgi:hypothetical protein